MPTKASREDLQSGLRHIGVAVLKSSPLAAVQDHIMGAGPIVNAADISRKEGLRQPVY
jgi:hypothetical protein